MPWRVNPLQRQKRSAGAMPAGSPVPTGTTLRWSMARLAAGGAADDHVLNRHRNVAQNALVNQKHLNSGVREAIRSKSVLT